MNGDLTPDNIDGAGSRRGRWPMWPIMLDVIGTLLLGLGIFGQFGGGDLPFLEFMPVQEYAIALILLGVLLMLPLIVVLIRRATSLTTR